MVTLQYESSTVAGLNESLSVTTLLLCGVVSGRLKNLHRPQTQRGKSYLPARH